MNWNYSRCTSILLRIILRNAGCKSSEMYTYVALRGRESQIAYKAGHEEHATCTESFGSSSPNGPDTLAVRWGTFHDSVVPMEPRLQCDIGFYQEMCAREGGHHIQHRADKSFRAIMEEVSAHARAAGRGAQVRGRPAWKVLCDADVDAAVEEVSDAVHGVGAGVGLASFGGAAV